MSGRWIVSTDIGRRYVLTIFIFLILISDQVSKLKQVFQMVHFFITFDIVKDEPLLRNDDLVSYTSAMVLRRMHLMGTIMIVHIIIVMHRVMVVIIMFVVTVIVCMVIMGVRVTVRMSVTCHSCEDGGS